MYECVHLMGSHSVYIFIQWPDINIREILIKHKNIRNVQLLASCVHAMEWLHSKFFYLFLYVHHPNNRSIRHLSFFLNLRLSDSVATPLLLGNKIFFFGGGERRVV
jgi:hypothetical protein